MQQCALTTLLCQHEITFAYYCFNEILHFLFAGASLTIDGLAIAVRQSSERWRTVTFESVYECVSRLVHGGVLQKSNNVLGSGLLVTLLVATQEVDEWWRIRVKAEQDQLKTAVLAEEF